MRRLEAEMALTGNPGDVFPPMVSYNVPWFVIRQLWPEAASELAEAPRWMAFAAAEEGWRGRLDNIKSEAEAIADGFRVSFSKTYVMTADRLLLLLAGPEGPALCRVERDPGWDWTERTEPGLSMTSSRGRTVAHYRVRGSAVVPASAVLSVPRRKYSRIGLLIPRREVTGMAMMALGMMRFLELAEAPGLLSERDCITRGRQQDSLGGAEVAAALRILDGFYAAAAGSSLEPFWSVVQSFRKTVAGALRLS